MFFINHTEIGDGEAALLEVEGPLNSETSPDFEEYIMKIIEGGISYILLDASKLHFISSEGIGVTLLVQKLIAEKNGFIVLFNLSGEVNTLYRLLGFDKVFTIAEDQSEAMERLDRQMEMRRTGLPPHREIETVRTSPDELDNSESEKPAENRPVLPEQPVLEPSPPVDFEAFIIKCLKCDSPVRINEPGRHICPHCRQGFDVTGPGEAIFNLNDTSH